MIIGAAAVSAPSVRLGRAGENDASFDPFWIDMVSWQAKHEAVLESLPAEFEAAKIYVEA